MRIKELKKAGRKSLKKHYWIFIAVCLFAAVLGTEYTESISFLSTQSSVETGKNDDGTAKEDASDNSTSALPSSVSNSASSTLLEDLIAGNNKKAEEKAKQEEEKASKKKETIGGVIALNHQKGILASLVNKISSGGIIVTVYSSIKSIVKDNDWAAFIFILSAALLLIALWVFLVNVYKVIMKRFFMEGATYEKVSLNRFVFLSRVGRHFKVSKSAFKWAVYETLWDLTIIGYFTKRYAYWMTPYILAENPDLTGSKAITLSRKMMYGYKRKAFLIELSFILWDLLNTLTLGIISLFYVAAYKESTYAEFYREIRELAISTKVEGYELLNDKYLFEKADSELIKQSYADVYEIKNKGTVLPKEKGFKGFIAKWFGIVPTYNEYEREYRRIQTNKAKIKNLNDAIEGKSYPRRLFALKEKEKKNREQTMIYTRRYSITSLILMFFFFCFLGWSWEVSLHLVQTGEFVNRGVNYGPWLPIYGTGGMGALLLFTRMKKYPVATFFASIVFCGMIEYIAGASLLAKYGARFWNYSGYFLNINGHVCAEGLLIFGVGCVAAIYVMAPKLDNIFCKIPLKAAVPICTVLLSVFIVDNIYSGKHPNVEGMSKKSRMQYEQKMKNK